MFEGYLPRNLADTPSARDPLRDNRNTVKAWAGDSHWRACRAGLGAFQEERVHRLGVGGFLGTRFAPTPKGGSGEPPKWLWAPARLALRVVRKLFVIVTLIDIHPDAEIADLWVSIIPHGGPIE